MSQRPEPMDELSRANPIDTDRLPSDSTARIWARVQEATMTEGSTSTSSRPKRPPWAVWGVGLAGVAVAGAVVLAIVLSGPAGQPDRGDTAETTEPNTGAASCVEMYSPETLSNRSWAFDGTVASIDGDRVTFTVNES